MVFRLYTYQRYLHRLLLCPSPPSTAGFKEVRYSWRSGIKFPWQSIQVGTSHGAHLPHRKCMLCGSGVRYPFNRCGDVHACHYPTELTTQVLVGASQASLLPRVCRWEFYRMYRYLCSTKESVASRSVLVFFTMTPLTIPQFSTYTRWPRSDASV